MVSPEGQITMDSALFMQGALLIIQFLLGWLVKSLFDRIKSLEESDKEMTEKIQGLAVTLPTNFVTKNDHEKSLNAIFDLLRRIDQKMDQKVDK